MASKKLLPYYSEEESFQLKQESPDAKSHSELDNIGSSYFSGYSFANLMALSIYDWTTANFFRQKLLLNYRYDFDKPSEFAEIDHKTISMIISKSNWYTYHPSNEWFMKSFGLEAVTNYTDNNNLINKIYNQSLGELKHTSKYVFAESRMLDFALRHLPKIEADELPLLSRGAYPYGLEINEFNKFSQKDNSSIWYHINEFKETTLSNEQIITTRTPWSFVDNKADATKYSQGVIINVDLSPTCEYWGCYYITPFSNNNTKTEYVCPQNSQFLINNITWGSSSEDKIEMNLTLLSCGENDICLVNQSKHCDYEC